MHAKTGNPQREHMKIVALHISKQRPSETIDLKESVVWKGRERAGGMTGGGVCGCKAAINTEEGAL